MLRAESTTSSRARSVTTPRARRSCTGAPPPSGCPPASREPQFGHQGLRCSCFGAQPKLEDANKGRTLLKVADDGCRTKSDQTSMRGAKHPQTNNLGITSRRSSSWHWPARAERNASCPQDATEGSTWTTTRHHEFEGVPVLRVVFLLIARIPTCIRAHLHYQRP